MSDQSASSKNDQENPSASNIKSPKTKNVVKILRAPGSKSNDESIDEEELQDFMKKGGYLIASSGSEGEEEPLMFRAIRKSKRHQLDYMRAVEDFRKKKSEMSVELNEDPSSGIWRQYLDKQGSSNTKAPEQKNVVRVLRASGQSLERRDFEEEYPISYSPDWEPDFRFGPPNFTDFNRFYRSEAELSYERRAEEERKSGLRIC